MNIWTGTITLRLETQDIVIKSRFEGKDLDDTIERIRKKYMKDHKERSRVLKFDLLKV